MSNLDIELDHVTKRFGDFTAVNDISFGIEKGEFITLLGPSGCGKTTTLRMVGGFIFPTRGEISINGVPMGRRPPNKRDSSMVFQNYALFPHMDISENISFGLKERKMPKEAIHQKVRDILELVNLTGFESRKPMQLSGGQQQRVALARSLVLEPTVLLLDEPLGALDLKMRKQMQEEVKALQLRLGITFIYVTHDQEEALVMSDTIAVMNKGRIEQIGPPKEVYERPINQFVAKFIGEANIFQGTVTDFRDKWLIINLAGGAATISNAKGIQKGEQVEFIVRPEKVLLGEPAQHADTTRKAEILRVVYKGSIATIVLKFGEGLEIQAQEQIVGRKSDFKKGDRVPVGWRADSAVPIQKANDVI